MIISRISYLLCTRYLRFWSWLRSEYKITICVIGSWKTYVRSVGVTQNTINIFECSGLVIDRSVLKYAIDEYFIKIFRTIIILLKLVFKNGQNFISNEVKEVLCFLKLLLNVQIKPFPARHFVGSNPTLVSAII